MATVLWTRGAGTYVWDTSANWSPSGAPLQNDVAYFANSGGVSDQTNLPVSTRTVGAIQSTSTDATISGTGGGVIAVSSGQFTPLAPTRNIYVADNKYLALNSTNNCSFTANCAAEVGSGGFFGILRYAGSGRLDKYGAGEVVFGFRPTPVSTGTRYNGQAGNNTGGVTVYAGSIVIQTSDCNTVSNPSTIPFGTGTLTFAASSTSLVYRNDLGGAQTYSIANPLTINSGVSATVSVASACTLTFSAASAASGTGSLTVTDGGTLVFSASSIPYATTLTGSNLTISASNNFTGSSLSGTGTLAMSGGSLGSSSPINASSHTGQITGSCSISGGTSTFASVFTGTISSISSGIITLTGTSTGGITGISNSTVTLSGSFAASTGTTTVTSANLRISGVSAGFNAGRTLDLAGTARLSLLNAASASNPVTSSSASAVTLELDDTSTATFGGNFTRGSGAGGTAIRAKDSGVLVLGGTLSSTTAFDLNGTAGYAGTLKATGAGFTGATATLSRGTLHLAGSANKSIGTTLTVSSGATVAYGPDVPVTLTGNLTLAANSTLRFGAPA